MNTSFLRAGLFAVCMATAGTTMVSCKSKAKPEVVTPSDKPVPPLVAPPPAPVIISADDSLTGLLLPVTKDFPAVKADVKGGVVTLTGEVERARLKTLIQSVQALHPKKVENKLVIK